MLEQGEKLRTWRLATPPDAAGPIDAEPLADHRVAYLDYEGPVSGGRGEVRMLGSGRVRDDRIDSGAARRALGRGTPERRSVAGTAGARRELDVPPRFTVDLTGLDRSNNAPLSSAHTADRRIAPSNDWASWRLD